jgi:hypothetical protein
MQQHEHPSQSKHLVFPADPPSGLTIDEIVDAADEPEPLLFTRVDAEEHILISVNGDYLRSFEARR